ncbi:heterokaryon incompatibility protein-domain-containing protein [Nemania sp. FL0916]|nr:heterokaryon incompatibility protein-domain-containing protein [Nemania sp. FL0916]
MDTRMEVSESRLCIFCRQIESASQPCPKLQTYATSPGSDILQPWDVTTHFSTEEADMLKDLQAQPSKLCRRCSAYNIVEVFQHAEPLDGQLQVELSNQDYSEYRRRIAQRGLRLGKLSSLHLTPSCQLCRLIYRILPKSILNPEDEMMTIMPVRSYVRITGWDSIPVDIRSQSAIFLGVYVPDYITPLGRSLSTGGPTVRLAEMTGEVIALRSSQTLPGRKYFNTQVVRGHLDYPLIHQAMAICDTTHGSRCHSEWPTEMSTTHMLDIFDRKIVPCPDKCDYTALSYVWGGVIPPPDALEKGTLPRTIEDAITVTKNLGRRYLWVDALCIDQRPVLKPAEASAKQYQLSIMHLIYQSAALTIVALSGDNSNWGLAGASPTFERAHQVQETIDGHDFFTVPPHHGAELTSSIWETRAWTLQEAFFARRALYITDNQAQFECGEFSIPESDDTDTYPPNRKTLQHPQNFLYNAFFRGFDSDIGAVADAPSPLKIYAGFINNYTARRLTNEVDSINAGLGMLTNMEKQLFKTGFVHGLPLRSHPQSLGWFHDRQCSPKRREAFPSWSWAGWEGDVYYPEMLLEPEQRGVFGPKEDLTVRFLAVEEREISVEGFVVELDIRTEPFSEAFQVGGHEAIGSVRENNFLHNNTLPSGIYNCLIIQRITYRIAEDRPEKEQVILLFIEWQGTAFKRMTLGTLNTFPRGSVMQAKPERKVIKLI